MFDLREASPEEGSEDVSGVSREVYEGLQDKLPQEMTEVLDNKVVLSQLRYRLSSLNRIEWIQSGQEAVELVRAEKLYVSTLIDYREKHGGLKGVRLED